GVRPDGLSLGCANEAAFRFLSRRPPWSAEPSDQFPAHRQAKAATQFREGLFSRPGLQELGELVHQAPEPGLVCTQYLDFLATLADFAGHPLGRTPPLAALGEDFLTVGAARRAQRVETFAPGLRLPRQ